jgi:pectin methylesterase-like acyl-CoA thioesterase
VDGTAGNDANDGQSLASAFKTIQKGVSVASPGATVLIKAGHYRERVSIEASGTSTSRIVVGALGDGPVVLDASDAVTGWTSYSGQIYRAHPASRCGRSSWTTRRSCPS